MRYELDGCDYRGTRCGGHTWKRGFPWYFTIPEKVGNTLLASMRLNEWLCPQSLITMTLDPAGNWGTTHKKMSSHRIYSLIEDDKEQIL